MNASSTSSSSCTLTSTVVLPSPDNQTVTLETALPRSAPAQNPCQLDDDVRSNASYSSDRSVVLSSSRSTRAAAVTGSDDNSHTLDQQAVEKTENYIYILGHQSTAQNSSVLLDDECNGVETVVESNTTAGDIRSANIDEDLVKDTEKENRQRGTFSRTGIRTRRKPLQLQQLEEPKNSHSSLKNKVTDATSKLLKSSVQGSKSMFSSTESIASIKNKDVSSVPSGNLPQNSKLSSSTSSRSSKRFKRIRLPNSDSSSEEDITPRKKQSTKYTCIDFTIGSSASRLDGPQTKVEDVFEKNSEELRLDEFDKNLFEYFDFNPQKVENPLNIDDKNNVAMNSSFDELPEISVPLASSKGKSESETKVSGSPALQAVEVSGDEDYEDEIPGTNEVLKNVAADLALIYKMRRKVKMERGTSSSQTQHLESDVLSQETVVLSSTQGSVDEQSHSLLQSQAIELISKCNTNLESVEKSLHSADSSKHASLQSEKHLHISVSRSDSAVDKSSKMVSITDENISSPVSSSGLSRPTSRVGTRCSSRRNQAPKANFISVATKKSSQESNGNKGSNSGTSNDAASLSAHSEFCKWATVRKEFSW